MAARILVVDDHEIVRKGICKLLEESGRGWEICGEADSGVTAVAAATTLRPDLIVLDVSMPVMSGLEAASRLARLGLSSRILLFTMHDSKMLSSEAQQVGAHGYVLKSQAARHLILAIERLLAGGTFFGSPETEAEPGKSAPPQRGGLFCLDFSFSD